MQVQIEATNYAIESEDFFFMEEQAQYLDEFMVAYYQYALVDEEGKPIVDAEEWTSRSAIEIPEPVMEEAEGTATEGTTPEEGEAEGDAAEGAEAAGTDSAEETGAEPAAGVEEEKTTETGNISE